MHWLGLDYDEGPDVGGPYAPYVQSKRLALYRQHAEELVEKGNAYYCFCSQARLTEMRERQTKEGKIPMYDGTCRKLKPAIAKEREKLEPHVIRLKVIREGKTQWDDAIRGTIAFENSSIDDQVLVKSDGYPTYHLAVVVDDHRMDISHVIRGEEWISSTPKHLMLYGAFGWKPPVFAHTPLLRNPDRSKLSKRRNPVSILWYQEQGYLPQALLNYLSLMGWAHPQELDKFSREDFIANFSLDKVKTTAPIFDLEKLRWLNGAYIREMDDSDLLTELSPFTPKGMTPTLARRVLPLVRERIRLLSEFNDQTEFFVTRPEVPKEEVLSQSKHTGAETKQKLQAFTGGLGKIKSEDFKAKRLEETGRSFVEKDWSPTRLFMTVRIAVTGKTATPPLFDTIEILGKKETLERLRDVQNQLR